MIPLQKMFGTNDQKTDDQTDDMPEFIGPCCYRAVPSNMPSCDC